MKNKITVVLQGFVIFITLDALIFLFPFFLLNEHPMETVKILVWMVLVLHVLFYLFGEEIILQKREINKLKGEQTP